MVITREWLVLLLEEHLVTGEDSSTIRLALASFELADALRELLEPRCRLSGKDHVTFDLEVCSHAPKAADVVLAKFDALAAT